RGAHHRAGGGRRPTGARGGSPDPDVSSLMSAALPLDVQCTHRAPLRAEGRRRMAAVLAISAVVMLVEAVGGWLAHSLALLADAAILHRGHHHSLNEHGAYLHVLSDALGSFGALVAGLIILTTGWIAADPLISIFISVLILASAWRLVKESTDILLEAAPAHIALSEVHDCIATLPGVASVHDLHVWTVTSGVIALSGHLVVQHPADNQRVLEAVQDRL